MMGACISGPAPLKKPVRAVDPNMSRGQPRYGRLSRRKMSMLMRS